MTPVEWNNLLLSLLNDKLWNDNQSFLHSLSRTSAESYTFGHTPSFDETSVL